MARTGPDGRYQIIGIEPGDHLVIVHQPGHSIFTHTSYTVTGSATFDIDASTVVITGRVIDRHTGLPLPDSHLRFLPAELGGRPQLGYDKISGPDGSFTVELSRKTRYAIEVTRGGYARGSGEVDTGAGPRTIDLFLAPSAAP
jgi:hypothetical protein